MEISKYIGLYLVKNNYCSLPGLGTLKLVKSTAVKQKNGEILPSTSSITFNNIGSIDDQLPHFIALNENISTNNASNAISTFGREVKDAVNNNGDYELEGLGKFYNNNGKVGFKQNNDLDLGAYLLSTSLINKNDEETAIDENESTEDKSINFDYNKPLDESASKMPSPIYLAKIILPFFLLLAVVIGGYYSYKYMQQDKIESLKPTIDSTTVNTPVKDTITALKDTITKVPVSNNTANVKVAILTFNNEESAKIKCEKLIKNGNAASVAKADSNNYNIVITVPASAKPTDKVVDSLRKFFNPNGKVFEIK